MSKAKFIWVLIFATAYSACSYQPKPTPDIASQPPTETALHQTAWKSIQMSQSGGIMGVSRRIQISSDGKYKINDERAQINLDGALSAQEMERLNSLIGKVDGITTPQTRPMCADCFVYTLEIQRKEKTFQIELSDMAVNGSRFEEVIVFLQGLIKSRLK